MHDDRFDDDDPELARWLRAVRADADPALWTRVRARIDARERMPVLLCWTMRPAALAASLALLIIASSLALMLAAGTPTANDDYASLAEALVADSETAAEPAPAPAPSAPAGGAATDTGAPR